MTSHGSELTSGSVVFDWSTYAARLALTEQSVSRKHWWLDSAGKATRRKSVRSSRQCGSPTVDQGGLTVRALDAKNMLEIGVIWSRGRRGVGHQGVDVFQE